MSKIDFSSVLNEMIGAAKNSLADKWPEVEELGTSSFKSLAQGLVDIEVMRLNGKITEEQARLLLDMNRSTLKIVLLSIEGIGLVAVEEAINAALNAVKDVVNTAVGFALL